MSSRWARRRRCASTCSTRRSRRSAASIRTRSARSMRSSSVRLLPAREVPLDAQAVKEFRRRFRTRFEGDPDRSRHLPRRQRGPGAGRDRVLPAAVLRGDGDAARLPARRTRSSCTTRRCRGALEQGLERHRRRATRTAATTSSGRCSPRRSCSSSRAQLDAQARRASPPSRSRPSRPTPSSRRAARRCATSPPPRRASCASTCAPSSRSPPLDCFPARSSTAAC